MKRGLFILIVLLSISLVLAHQPRYVMDQKKVAIRDVEVSQAFYGELGGTEDIFIINSQKDFSLYVNILSPKDGRTDFVVEVSNFTKLENENWTEFYEEFAGDYYLKGEEFEKNCSAGQYTIKVYNEDNQGRYVLAVGKIEKFSISDLLVLPRIKHDFFNKSYFAVFEGIIGSGLLVLLILMAITILIILKLAIKKGK